MVIANLDLLILLDAAPFNAADGDTADEFIVVDGGNQHLEGCVQVHFRGGDVVQDRLKQGLQVGARHVRVFGCDASAGRTEQDGRIQLFFIGIQIQQ